MVKILKELGIAAAVLAGSVGFVYGADNVRMTNPADSNSTSNLVNVSDETIWRTHSPFNFVGYDAVKDFVKKNEKDICGPESDSIIPEVNARIVYNNGETETLPLWTVNGGADTGTLLWNSKRAMPAARSDVKSFSLEFPGKKAYDGSDGVYLYAATANPDSASTSRKNPGVQIDLDDLLGSDWTLDKSELEDISEKVGKGRPIPFVWVAQDMNDKKITASITGDVVLFLNAAVDSTYLKSVEQKLQEKSGELAKAKGIIEELENKPPVVITEYLSSDGESKDFAGIGYKNFPFDADGVFAVYGMDNLGGTRVGLSANIGMAGAGSSTTNKFYEVTHGSQGRVHEFWKNEGLKNRILFDIGTQGTFRLTDKLYAGIGGGVILGDQGTTLTNGLAARDAEGNLINPGVDNPREVTTEDVKGNSAYLSGSLRAHTGMDLGPLEDMGVLGGVDVNLSDEKAHLYVAMVGRF